MCFNGEEIPCEGQLFYRGYNINELCNDFFYSDRYGFEEIKLVLRRMYKERVVFFYVIFVRLISIHGQQRKQRNKLQTLAPTDTVLKR